MFSKIMPSGPRTPQEEASVEGTPAIPAQPAAEPLAAPAAPSMAVGTKKSVIDPRKEVRLNEPEPTALVNLMERMVAEKLDAAIDKFHCCKCDKCKKDVAAIALNKLKPRYVVVDKLSVLSEERQTNAEVTTAIIQAILIVKAHPRH